MAAAVHVISRKREAARQSKRTQQKQIEEVFQEFDVNKNGLLERTELSGFLRFLNNDKPVSDDEVALVLHIADSYDGVLDGGVSRKEFLVAADAWSSYNSNKDYVMKLMSKFDKSKNGTLSQEELKELLQDLNDGDPPSASELEQVFRFADKKDGTIDGVIKPTELVFAISFWYSMLEEEKSLFDKVSNNYRCGPSGCLIV
ncbi:hypothetical protein CYMTET_33630 [Cymbomonas tetramitiformis]|uniref:EF-hand domain-containing protein n=1 Tax=Cymbomonas tetramitiformis TaxID=36881 RepID=A0AAE0FCT4_9CHLO|nr:hypothetical protein CYMTET_33630 [Cymbomonas tetramitiformis]|eukprot:gene14348-16966_t